MSGDSAGLSDEVHAELNPADPLAPQDQAPSVPARPADGAPKARWADYVVALGADRAFVSADTQHWEGDKDTGRLVTLPGLTRDELIDLADRLGG